MKALRTAKLVIDVPTPEAEPFIMGILQKVVLNTEGDVLQVIPRQDELYRRSSQIITDTISFTDPVTQTQHTLSGAGLQVAITAMVSKWLIEDYTTPEFTPYVDENGRVIIEEG